MKNSSTSKVKLNGLPLAASGLLLSGVTYMTSLFSSGFGMNMDPLTYKACLIGGGVLATLGLVKVNDIDYDRFFKEVGLYNSSNETPKLTKEKKTDYGYDLHFKMPIGKSIKDFLKDEVHMAFENFVNSEVEFTVNDKAVVAQVHTGRLFTRYNYTKPEDYKTKHPYQLYVGHSRDGLEMLDMSEFPHILIGGSTNAGKSVLLKMLITTLISNWDTSQIELYLVDFKQSDLPIFRNCKHVKQVFTKVEQLSGLFAKIEQESDKRQLLFKSHDDISNIFEFNEEYPKLKSFPYTFIVIDEIHYLEGQKDILSTLSHRIAVDRSRGIFYILCTQRPSTDILPGTMKNNLNVRVGLKVGNHFDSITILGEPGAEYLRGKGHALVKNGGGKKEVQTIFIDRKQIKEFIEPSVVYRPEVEMDTSGVEDYIEEDIEEC